MANSVHTVSSSACHAAETATAGAYLCPPDLLLRARSRGPQPIAVAAAAADHVLHSVFWAAEFGLIKPILVGSPPAIQALARAQNVDPASYRMVPAETEAEAADRAVSLVARGEARILMKGHLHTEVLMRAALRNRAGLRRGSRLSHTFAMRWPGAPDYLLITDAALNVAPDSVTMAYVVRHAVRVAQVLGIAHPRIAVLSATETVNPAMPSSVAAGEFATSFREEAVSLGCSIAGPLALDVALSAASAALKGLGNDPVAGRANILVVPNIETGNALFKTLVHLLNATAIGIVLGAAAPIVLTSRADSVESKLASIALACLLSEDGDATN